MRNLFELNDKDAIYITSWAAYNDGNSLRDGGWFNIAELADLSNEEIFDRLRLVGLEPDGYDEELVIHDYDDYSNMGYYELFGEAYPLTVINFYRKLQDLDDNEILAFIGIRETRSAQEALEALENEELDNYGIYTEDGFNDMLKESLEVMVQAGDLDNLRMYVDEDSLKEDLEMDITIDDETGEPEYEVDDYMIEDIIESADVDYLERYFDMERYERDVLMDGYYSEFEWDNEVFYIYEW